MGLFILSKHEKYFVSPHSFFDYLQHCPARSDEATARSDEATARSDEATARSDNDEELKRTSRRKLKSYVSPSKLNFGTKELPPTFIRNDHQVTSYLNKLQENGGLHLCVTIKRRTQLSPMIVSNMIQSQGEVLINHDMPIAGNSNPLERKTQISPMIVSNMVQTQDEVLITNDLPFAGSRNCCQRGTQKSPLIMSNMIQTQDEISSTHDSHIAESSNVFERGTKTHLETERNNIQRVDEVSANQCDDDDDLFCGKFFKDKKEMSTKLRISECYWREDELLSRYTDYFAKALSGISLPWVNMFNESPNLSTLIDVPLSHIPLIPLLSFEILVLLISPSRSTRVKSTEKVEAIYPLLKDVALSPDVSGGSNAMKQMFTFALRSARKGIVTGNHVLAEEATSIAIWCVLQFINTYK
ncbi:BnaC09g15470D [Brassica napus]|uniref:BnaC09g15470D protein n=1 Tax=Brassica napus TaxID=3708 RepID=A0A078GRP4_BRANA|nr:BnaC09g15470D [Brassica napus]